MRQKVVTFGEIMLRLSTSSHVRFVQAHNFIASFGGGEANVAASLANYGIESYFVSKLPLHEIGQSAINYLRSFGVNTEFIIRGGNRIGIYFLETGASQRASKVIYDRRGSSISEINRDEIEWVKVFENAKWFHWTGITPALSKNLQECLFTACKVAKENNVIISCDLNFRSKLWNEKEAQSTMIPLMEFVDVCIANEEDCEKCLGVKIDKSNIESGQIDFAEYFELAKIVKTKFNFDKVAITLRESYSASKNGWSALIIDNKDCIEPYHSKKYDVQIVDRVGSGDAFAAGLIYGILKKENTKDALEFAVAASCLKQTIHGDFNLVSVAEVDKLLEGTGSGRVER